MITELKNPLTEEYKNLKELVLSPYLHWFYLDKTTDSKNKDLSFFSHHLLSRQVHEIEGKKVPAIPVSTSPYFEKCYFILKEILDYNNIGFEVMYRMNINLTLHSKIKESVPHIDLNLPHKVVIVYLTEFTKGRTIVLEEDKQKFYSNPKEDNVIMFDGALTHYQECPDIDEKRIVMIANFQ
tara:strand:- start:8689 stop:9234 length:546 start_codon:yes stop_codon:yes gene_type:complete